MSSGAPPPPPSLSPAPRILSLATAVPPHLVPQAEALAFFNRFFDITPAQRERLKDVFVGVEIETRYAAAPVEWFMQAHSFEEKNTKYIDTALKLLKQVAIESVATAGLECKDIDTIVVVSTSGIAVPSLDARLMEELPFRRNVQRLPVFGLGCAGGVLGLARAAACARAQPGSRVLCLVVELCTLTFCASDRTATNIVATALFGDGAAGAVLTTEGTGPAVGAWGEYTWPRTLDVMGWHLTQNGLELRMERRIPDLVKEHVRGATNEFLASAGLDVAEVDEFVCHPGGPRVLEALEAVFELPPRSLAPSWAVMREYGNMSAATVLFVLKHVLDASSDGRGGGRRYLMTALGPGFSIAFLVLEGA